MEKYQHIEHTDKDLKQIAKDIYNNLVFTDRHIKDNSMLANYFMPLIFFGPREPKPEKGEDIKDERNKKIEFLKNSEELEENYQKELIEYEKFMNDVGLVYEYYSNSQSPVSLNGLPMFFSCRFLNKKDTEKMFEFYEKYKTIRETADNF